VQVITLKAAGCSIIHEEVASGGAGKSRPVLAQILKTIKAGDVLLVVRLDRLARSLPHLLDTIERLGKRGAHLRSLNDPVDTTTPQGVFAVQIMGAVAELERGLLIERTKAGLAASRKLGRIGGNPLAKDRNYIETRAAALQERYIEAASPDELIPIIKRMRPQKSWPDVALVINAAFPDSEPWNRERLTRLAWHLVKRGKLDEALMKPLKDYVRRDRPGLKMVVAMFKKEPEITLLEVAQRLEDVGMPTARGGTRWYPSTVADIRKQAIRKGYLPLEDVADP
jgi:hypothetical protein